jgi:GntR family transcriptional repressor for pyruvate dehydrogenase complex
MFQPVKRVKLHEDITQQIINMISNGELMPGDRLPTERELAEKLGVSRPVIRESLRTLETSGFIVSSTGSGTFVREMSLTNAITPFSDSINLDKKTILELIDLRSLLEAETVRLAANNITPAGVAKLKAALVLMEKEVQNGEIGLNGDNIFHETIAEIAGNSALREILNLCKNLLRATRKAALETPGQPKRAIVDHTEIYNAIIKKDVEMATQLIREHMEKAHKNIESRQI